MSITKDFAVTQVGDLVNSRLIRSYITHTESSIDKLPKKEVWGTMGDDPEKNPDNAPCEYGSTCTVLLGNSNTIIYQLATDNEWKKM